LSACRVSSTSGTTGDALAVYFSAEDETLVNLSWTRGFLARGLKAWHKNAAFVGRPRVKKRSSWYEKIGLWRREEISSWDPPSAWVDSLRRIRPRVITGYVMTLNILAEELRANHPDPVRRGFRPAAIFHSSAVLDEASRRDLEETFGAVVADFYGANEAGCIAWECPDCGAYHINADRVIVEVLKDGRPAAAGECGDIVITNLHSRVMPFIRYSLGDVGRLSTRPVRCGRGLPLMDRVEGRSDDFIVLPSGEKISPHPLYHCLDPVPGIRRWRIVQPAPDCLDVAIEPGPDFSPAALQSVRENLERLLQGRLSLEIAAVKSLPVSPSAKFRSVRSNVRGGRG
ncbi:MAG: phenylacetate--CoA ligase family protein, partial [Candidatus Aminicenantes bacterium]|nr:phenylacetate--CoA ligase family protein [Candidatus Aminicenantes bacterium]